MYNLNLRGSGRKRRSHRLARDLGWLFALGVAVSGLVTGYCLASPGGESAAPGTSATAPAFGASATASAGLGSGGGGGGASDGGGRRHHHHDHGF